ncbi:MAG TPA: hypothetical protein VN844_17650 [Pyrinomonadaceae bacterium]|nr:hypothetical protein [Pyrinomonadaceae bacterium]
MELRHKLPLLTTALIVTLIMGTRFVSSVLTNDIGGVDPRITLPPNQAHEILERQRRQQVQAFVRVSEGEVARTEERIREATAVALGVSLFAATESLAHRIPASDLALLSGVQKAGLLPPGMRLIDNSALVTSERGTLRVRYRPEPLCIEVVSIGRERTDGPALLLRAPSMIAGKDDTRDVVLYTATRLDDIRIPQPFASEAQIIALGFAPEPLRAATLPSLDTAK